MTVGVKTPITLPESLASQPVQSLRAWCWQREQFVLADCQFSSSILSLDPVAQQQASAESDVPLLLPAPVDLHVHGGGGADVMESEQALRQTLTAHARSGTGAMLATSVTAPTQQIDTFLDTVAAVMAAPDTQGATLLGAHLEGPFISPDKLGAQPPYAKSVSADALERWFSTGVVRVITFAPEQDEHNQLLGLCERYGVKAQIGHSNCDWASAAAAIRAGCGVTHLYNAMSGFSHRSGGIVAGALAYAEYAEIIADGEHVDRAAFDVARRAIPSLYSVTDATAAAGMPDGEYQLGSLAVTKQGSTVRLPDGTLAGSCLTQLEAIQQLRQWGIEWLEIGAITSARPATWINQPLVGSLVPGALAHWIEVRNDRAVAVWHYGRRQLLPAEFNLNGDRV